MEYPRKGKITDAISRERDMLTDDMNDIGILCRRDTDQEIIWFDVSVNERLVVDRLNARDLGHQCQKLFKYGIELDGRSKGPRSDMVSPPL